MEAFLETLSGIYSTNTFGFISPNMLVSLNQESCKKEATKMADDINKGNHCKVTEEKEAEYNNDDFSFSRAFHGINTRNIESDDVFYFKPVFPYFNQHIVLADNEDINSLKEKDVFKNVNKVFVRMPHYANDLLAASITSGNVEIVRPCCDWDKNNTSAEVAPQRSCKKGNISTRLSKIFKLKQFLHRNKNDGRDVIVYVKTSVTGKGQEKAAGTGKKMKELLERKVEGNEFKGKKVVSRKNSVFLAQQNYIRNRAMEEDRRRAYLAHRAIVLGFSTVEMPHSPMKKVESQDRCGA